MVTYENIILIDICASVVDTLITLFYKWNNVILYVFIGGHYAAFGETQNTFSSARTNW